MNSMRGILAPCRGKGEPGDEPSCEPEDFMCSDYSGCYSAKKRAWSERRLHPETSRVRHGVYIGPPRQLR